MTGEINQTQYVNAIGNAPEGGCIFQWSRHAPKLSLSLGQFEMIPDTTTFNEIRTWDWINYLSSQSQYGTCLNHVMLTALSDIHNFGKDRNFGGPYWSSGRILAMAGYCGIVHDFGADLDRKKEAASFFQKNPARWIERSGSTEQKRGHIYMSN